MLDYRLRAWQYLQLSCILTDTWACTAHRVHISYLHGRVCKAGQSTERSKVALSPPNIMKYQVLVHEGHASDAILPLFADVSNPALYMSTRGSIQCWHAEVPPCPHTHCRTLPFCLQATPFVFPAAVPASASARRRFSSGSTCAGTEGRADSASCMHL